MSAAPPVVTLPLVARLELTIGQQAPQVATFEEVVAVEVEQVLADPHAVRRAVWQALGRVAATIAGEVEALAGPDQEVPQ